MPHYGSGWQRFGLWSRFCFKIYCDYIKQLMSGFKSSTAKYFIWAWKVSLLAPLSFSVVPSDWRNLRPCLAAQPQTHPEHGIRGNSHLRSVVRLSGTLLRGGHFVSSPSTGSASGCPPRGTCHITFTSGSPMGVSQMGKAHSHRHSPLII